MAFLNMTDPDETCPEHWRLYEQQNLRACGRQQSNTASCESVQFNSGGYSYTQVCGRVTGYQYNSPDAGYLFDGPPLTPGNEINEPYIDGVSVTYGTPRQHLWSLYAAFHESRCCNEYFHSHIESFNFTGSNYFCDTTNNNIFSSDSPLWDGNTPCTTSSSYLLCSSFWAMVSYYP